MRSNFIATLAALLFVSCKSLKEKSFEYEIIIRTNSLPVAPQKFISYKNILFNIEFNRYDSTVYKVNKDSSKVYTRLDTSNRWIIKKENGICYKINTLGGGFNIIDQDSLVKRMQVNLGGSYVFDKVVRDTTIQGMHYFYADSAAFNNRDSMLIKYFFIKSTELNTVYSFLNIRHKDPAFKYAGFTMDDYKNKFYFINLLVKLKEADAATLKLCEVVYARFKQLNKEP
jgi:hypothetical protein